MTKVRVEDVLYIPVDPLILAAIMSGRPRGSPLCTSQSVWMVTTSYVYRWFGGRVPSCCRTSATRARLGTLAASIGSGGVNPKVIASGAIAWALMQLASIWSQCSRLPVHWIAGMRGTWRRAIPMRAAHHDAATAMLKASGAVYSASSWLGYTRTPLTTVGVHSLGSCVWWQSNTGQASISSRLCLNLWDLARTPPKTHAEYKRSPWVFPNWGTASFCQRLDLVQNKRAGLVILLYPCGIFGFKVWKAKRIMLGSERLGCGPTIIKGAWDFSGSTLSRAVQRRCNEVDGLQLFV